MDNTFIYIVIAVFVSGILSMIGGVILLGRERWVKKFSLHFVSFAAGALLAGAFLDLLPEAVHHAEETGADIAVVMAFALIAFIAFFILDRTVNKLHCHYYQCDPEHAHATPTLLLIGDGLHNFVDGIVIASAFLVDVRLGIVTALAVAAHELPQEISDFSIMLHHGWSKAKVLITNVAVSLTSVVGALIAYLSRDFIEPYLPGVLAFTAGIFIYIAAADILPELSPKTSNDRISHVVILMIIGIAIVWLAGHGLPVHE